MRKILYSPGYGAGWSSWNSGEVEKLMIDYQPIISAIESGESMTKYHPAVKQLEQECLTRFNEKHVCILGADDLRVAEVSGPVRITEHEGSESYEEPGQGVYL